MGTVEDLTELRAERQPPLRQVRRGPERGQQYE